MKWWTISVVVWGALQGGLLGVAIGYHLGYRKRTIVARAHVIVDMRLLNAVLERKGLVAMPKGVPWRAEVRK